MNRRALFHAALVSLALTAFSGHARAATDCNTGPAPNKPLTGTVTNGVVVNGGDFCVIAGATVSGGVRVNPGGVLIVCGTTINGGFISNGAAELIFGAEEIQCPGNVINGSVQVSNGGPGIILPAPAVALENSTINGSVHLSGNAGPIAVAANRIGGALVCSNNAYDLEDEGMPNFVTGAVRCSFGEGE